MLNQRLRSLAYNPYAKNTQSRSYLDSLFERTKDTIFSLMAKNMTKKDVSKFKPYWESKLQEGGEEIQKVEEIKVEKKEVKKTEVPKHISAAPKPPEIRPVTATSSDVFLYHPLLGELVSDLGYKRLYLTNVQGLARTPVWKKQRILRPERAALIADDKIRKGFKSTLSGVISLYQDKETREFGIIDGQHRAGALMILAQRGYWDESKRNILLEVFPTHGEDSVISLFREINAAEPVRLIDLPEMANQDDESEDDDNSKPNEPSSNSSSSATATTTPPPDTVVSTESPQNHVIEVILEEKEAVPGVNEKVIIGEAVEQLRQKYSEMFKPTSRCKVPHVNIDVLRDDLFNSNILAHYNISSTANMIEKLEYINEQLAVKYKSMKNDPEQAKTFTKSYSTALNKAENYNFFLGMEKNWIYHKYE